MSLRVDDRSGRSRGRSPGGGDRDRSRSRSNVRAPEAPMPPAGSYGYAGSDVQSSAAYEVRSPPSNYVPTTTSAPGAWPTAPTAPAYPQGPSAPYPQEANGGGYAMGDYKDYPPHDRPEYYHRDSYSSQTRTSDNYRESESNRYSRHNSYDDYPPERREPERREPDRRELDRREHERRELDRRDLDRRDPERRDSERYSRHDSYDSYPPQPQPPRAPQSAQAPRQPQPPSQYQYAPEQPKYQYAQPPEKLTYNTQPHAEQYAQYPPSSQSRYGDQPQRGYSQSSHDQPQRTYPQSTHDQPHRTYSQSTHDQIPRPYSQSTTHDQHARNYSQSSYDSASVVDITPYGDNRQSRAGPSAPAARPPIDHRSSGGLHAPGAGGLTTSMGLLAIGGPPPIGGGGGLPPPSPLLEAYRGTYQQMSPLPLALRPADEDDLSDLEPLSPTVSTVSKKSDSKKGPEKDVRIAAHAHETIIEKDNKKEGRRVKVYDPEADAKTISKALQPHHGKSVNAEAICDILPLLTHDQIVYLRKEYKKQVKIQGKGVNLSKHIKTKLTGNFCKVAYVTALGRWESEGYWANFFYQSHGSRRELLIESLMGRSNREIGEIKDEFKDKRYSDDLVKCMEKELKMDKFRTAVLMALEQRRQEEQDVYPTEYKVKDVETLHRALTAPKGGESTILEIIVLRSDAHLRDVVKMYQQSYGESFPRAALKKSNNLVGEVIAHILNGVINKPARDALLLRHAIEDVAEKNKEEELRYELLISRLVRFHWDRMHFVRVKKEYETKYGVTVEEEIEEATKGDFCEFMLQLCEVKGS